MKKFALAGAVALVALALAGCLSPSTRCAAYQAEHTAWVAKGKPVKVDGKLLEGTALKLAQAAIEAGYDVLKKGCAAEGIVIE